MNKSGKHFKNISTGCVVVSLSVSLNGLNMVRICEADVYRTNTADPGCLGVFDAKLNKSPNKHSPDG